MATTYYVKPTGNDANSGTSEALAFKTSAKLATVLQRGDTALYECNGTYEPLILSSLSASGTIKITIDSFGSGSRPVISAFISPAGSWVSEGGNKWSYTNAQFVDVTVLTMGGVDTPMGRWPESGFGTIQNNTGATAISDSTTLAAAPDLVGGELVTKKRPWTVDRMRITAQDAATLTTVSDGFNYKINYQYFVQNHPNCLYKNGDWCYVDSEKKVYIYSDTDPNALDIKVSFYENAFRLNTVPHINIGYVTMEGSRDIAAFARYSNYVYFDRCKIRFAGTNGLQTFVANHLTWRRGEMRNVNNNGLLNRDASPDLTVMGSKFTDIATKLGAGLSGDGNHCAIFINNTEHRATITDNYISKAGNNGVFYRGDGTRVESNYVEQAGYLVSDAAAFYSFGNFNTPYTGIICRRNIAHNCHANTVLTNRTQDDVCAFYFDDNANDYECIENVGWDCGYGLYLHNNKLGTVQRNILFDNGQQLRIKDDNVQGAGTTFRVRDMDISSNTFKAKAGQIAVAVVFEDNVDDTDPYLMGLIDNNNHDYADAESFQVNRSGQAAQNMTLAAFRTETGFDLNSTENPFDETTVNALVNTTEADTFQELPTFHTDWDGFQVETVSLEPNQSVTLFDTGDPSSAFQTYSLTLLAQGNGTVTNNSAPGPYEPGEVVNLVATPLAGSVFVRWTIDGQEYSKSANINYEMNADTELVAVFQEAIDVQVTLRFLIPSDYLPYIRTSIKEDILLENTDLLKVEMAAQEEISSYLAGRYDMTGIFMPIWDYVSTRTFKAGEYVHDEGVIYRSLVDQSGVRPSQNVLEDDPSFVIDDPRNPLIVLRMIYITLYHAHKALPGQQIPKLRIDDYDISIRWLEKVASGVLNPLLPQPEEDGNFLVAYGSETRRVSRF